MLPRTILDRIHQRKGRFSGLRLSERDVEEVLREAARALDLDLSGASLVEDIPFFIVDAISRNNYYEYVNVDLGGAHLAQQGFDVLSEAIVQFRDLESLNLRNNLLPKEAAVAIAKILGAKSKLRILDVHDNFLGDAGVAVIAGAFTTDLSQSKHYRSALMSLKVLDLSSNHIGDLGILALCRGLLRFAKHLASIDKTSALVSLRLDQNKIGDKGAICIAQLLSSCHAIGTLHIEELSVCDNPIGPDGLSALLTATRRMKPEAVDESILNSSHRLMLDSDGILVGGSAELDIALSQLNESIRHREGGLLGPSDGGPIVVLRASGCKVTVPILDELAALLRSGGSQLHTIDLSMTRAAARDLSQQPGFKEAILSLNESVAKNPIIQSVHLGDLLEVCSTAAVALPIDSAESASLRLVVDAMHSMSRILKMDNSLQRQMWYAGHYNDISNAATLSPQRSSSYDLEDRGLYLSSPPAAPTGEVRQVSIQHYSTNNSSNNSSGSSSNNNAASMRILDDGDEMQLTKRDAVATLVVPGIPIEKAELDKIRRSHGTVFSELSQGIHELSAAAQHARSSAMEALAAGPSTSSRTTPGGPAGPSSYGSSSGSGGGGISNSSRVRGASSAKTQDSNSHSLSSPVRGGYGGAINDNGSPSSRSVGDPTTPYFPHGGFLDETMASAIRRVQGVQIRERSSPKRRSSGGSVYSSSNNNNNNSASSSRGSNRHSASNRSFSSSGSTTQSPSRRGRFEYASPNSSQGRNNNRNKTATKMSLDHNRTTNTSPDAASDKRMFDEASVEAMIKAAVRSALSLASSTTPVLEPVDLMPPLRSDKSSTGQPSYDEPLRVITAPSVDSQAHVPPTSTSSSSSMQLLEARVALVEDKIEGIEALETMASRMRAVRTDGDNKNATAGGGDVSMNKTTETSVAAQDEKDALIESLLQTVVKLEARLEATEARLSRLEVERRSEAHERSRDESALKDFIVHIEEAQSALAERLAHVELTVEEDSETSIGLLDILLKKLDK